MNPYRVSIVLLATSAVLVGCDAGPVSGNPVDLLSGGLAQTVREERSSTQSIDCYYAANKETLLSRENAFLLCYGARSLAPVACYLQGRKDTFLDDADLLALCRCSQSADPIACYMRGRWDPYLTDQQVVVMCSPIFNEQLYASCIPIQIQ